MIRLQSRRMQNPVKQSDHSDRAILLKQRFRADPSLREVAFELGRILGDDATRLSGIAPSSDLAEAIREISAQLR